MARSPLAASLGCLVAGVVASVLAASPASANVRRVDLEPPLFVATVAPFVAADGTLFAVHDGRWAAIAFIRPTELVPPDSDLLSIDPRAFGTPMLVAGFGIFPDAESPVPLATEVHGLGAVPVWFADWDELQHAMADGVLLFAELEALPSLLRGTATYYQEQNHFSTHRVSALAAVARGVLEDGRRFDLEAVEVQLGLRHVRIRFR